MRYNYLNRSWLVLTVFLMSLLSAVGQTTLTLYYGDPAAGADQAFDGNVLQSGSQTGDAPFYVKFGGSTTNRSFQIDSPGENRTLTITQDGFYSIRPVTSMVIDQSKIKNFAGTVSGSVIITVRQLAIKTISANVATDVPPGSEIAVTYETGAGTFPVDLAISGFKVQLLDASGNLITDLLNPKDQYAGREKSGSSFGGTRTIRATIPATVSAGTYRVRVVTQGLNTNVVGSASSTFMVKTNTPTLSVGTLDNRSYCAGSTVAFPFTTTGTYPTGSTFKVQLIDGSGNSQDLSGENTTSPISAALPATLSSGSYRFRIISSAATLTSATSPITVSALPTMKLSGNVTIAAGETAPVDVILTGTPPWTFTYRDDGPAYAPGNTRTLTASASPVTIRPTFFSTTTYDRAYITNFRDAGCGNSTLITESARITVNQVTITTGTVAGNFCPGATISVPFTVGSTLPTDVVYQVQLSDASGNFQTSQVIGSSTGTGAIRATIPSTLAVGAGYKLRVVVQKPAGSGAVDYSNSISAVASALTVSRPELPRVANVSFCPGTSTSQLSATGDNLKWYVDGSAQALTGAPTPPNDRSSRYLVTQTIDGCESLPATIVVSLKPVPAPPSISSVAICQGAQGQFQTSAGNLLWYTNATGGTGASQSPSISSQTTGDQFVYVTQTVDGCESSRATVKATVNPIPSAPTVQVPNDVCQYVQAPALTATGSSLTWYGQSGKLAGAPVPNTSASGVVSYSVTQTVNNCESPRAVVNQIVLPAPGLPTAASVRYCVGETPRSLTATGTRIQWYTAQTGGTASASPPAFSTGNPAVLTFYVTQTDDKSCESLRQPVSVSVAAAPSAPLVNASQVVCQNTSIGALSASPNIGLIWQGPSISGSSEIAPVPSTAQPGVYQYSVVQKQGNCVSPASIIALTVRRLPDAPKVAPLAAFCIGQSNALLTAVADGRLTWYTNADRSGASSAQVNVNTGRAATFTYYVTQTDTNRCESLNSVLNVRVSAKATARLTGDGDVTPGDSTAIRIRLTGDGPWTFNLWDGKSVPTADSLHVVWVKPLTNQRYAITNLQSACGAGDILNSYTLLVRAPLSTQSSAEPFSLNVYPNPTVSDVTVDWSSPVKQAVTLQLVNAAGRVIWQVNRTATTLRQTEQFQLSPQPTGQYYLRVLSDMKKPIIRTITKQ